jgi:thiamine biosynthesis lipoprotein
VSKVFGYAEGTANGTRSGKLSGGPDSTQDKYYEHTIVAMGTTARLGVYAKSESGAHEVITRAFGELKRVEQLFSIYEPTSEVSAINRSAGLGPVTVSADTFGILTASVEYAHLTRRAFDITVEPVMELWGFRSRTNALAQLPTVQQINAALQYVGYDQLELDSAHSQVRLRSRGARIDLGGVAVGYALDRMVEIVRAAGIERAFLDISGDMYALGAPDGKEGWEVGIPNPQSPDKIIHRTHIKNEALATSGNYMSYVVYNAVKYGHIMDPHEGRSACRMISSTVIAPTGIDADALSTASFVSGKRYKESRLLLVTPQGTVEESHS